MLFRARALEEVPDSRWFLLSCNRRFVPACASFNRGFRGLARGRRDLSGCSTVRVVRVFRVGRCARAPAHPARRRTPRARLTASPTEAVDLVLLGLDELGGAALAAAPVRDVLAEWHPCCRWVWRQPEAAVWFYQAVATCVRFRYDPPTGCNLVIGQMQLNNVSDHVTCGPMIVESSLNNNKQSPKSRLFILSSNRIF
jgi:hypothetical protein